MAINWMAKEWNCKGYSEKKQNGARKTLTAPVMLFCVLQSEFTDTHTQNVFLITIFHSKCLSIRIVLFISFDYIRSTHFMHSLASVSVLYLECSAFWCHILFHVTFDTRLIFVAFFICLTLVLYFIHFFSY